MEAFNPFDQNVTFLSADGETPINIPMASMDQFNFESFSVCISYGSQIGASFIMLLVVLIMTPSSKRRRPSSILHVLGLTVCMIRGVLLSVYFTSPFNEFYNFWSMDASRVPIHNFYVSVTSTVFSLLLVIILEVALMNQAWTMVSLWPPYAKYPLSGLSILITLMTIGWRFAISVVQSQAIMSSQLAPAHYHWMIDCAVITNAVSICWYCALFNVKLVTHIVSNRGILPSHKALTPMEVLVMTNGLLMIIPVIFSGLEWGRFTNFEAASVTLTAVAIILPMGTLTAQRMAQSNNVAFCSAGSSNQGVFLPETTGWPSWPSSTVPLKPGSFASGSGSGSGTTGTTPQLSIMSRCEAGMKPRDRADDAELELIHIDTYRELAGGRVRVDHDFEQRVDRV